MTILNKNDFTIFNDNWTFDALQRTNNKQRN